MALGNDNAFAHLDFAAGTDQFAGTGAGGIAALTDRRIDADGACIGGRQLDLIGRTDRTENGNIGQLLLGTDNSYALVAGILTGLRKILFLGQLIAGTEQYLNGLLSDMNMTGRSFNQKRHDNNSSYIF